jgi:hypothetical protein
MCPRQSLAMDLSEKYFRADVVLTVEMRVVG